MKIFIGCDCIGFKLKDAIAKHIEKNHKEIELIDCGCLSDSDNTAYPIFAEKVCKGVLSSEKDARGILICGTGIGMSITANKFNGIYAAVCHDEYSCERSILSNNANVMCMGQRIISEYAAIQLVDKWLSLIFYESPSSRKISMIYAFEKENMRD